MGEIHHDSTDSESRISSFGSYCGLNYAYAYIKNIVTYTAADFIHDNLEFIAGAIGVILFVLVIVFARHDQDMRKIARKEAKQKKELEEALEAARLNSTRNRQIWMRSWKKLR